MTRAKLKKLTKLVAAHAIFNSMINNCRSDILTDKEFEKLQHDVLDVAFEILGNTHVPTEALFVKNVDLLIEYL